MKYILVATSNNDARHVINFNFKDDCSIHTALTFTRCLNLFQERRYEYIFLDLELLKDLRKKSDYKEIFQSFWRLFPSVEIVVLCSPQLIREAVHAVKAGASDYLTFPLHSHEVQLIVENIDDKIRLQSELDYLRDRFWRSESLAILRTNSPVMKEVFNKVRSVSQSNSTVLLTGETGTGKGVIANLIHQHSQRRENQFINIHCGAIPETLLESELFGHEKGAFTGAVRRKLGKFEIAQAGTIFLDEIGTITHSIQVKLLQVLQEKIFQRVGGEVSIEADVRIIAATNADLKDMVKNGTFRSDLYYRLNVFPIEIPPLRERIADIPLLVEQFIKKLNRFNSKDIRGIDSEVLQALQNYTWPGNIRELENIVERAYILETSSILSRNSFPHELFDNMNEAHFHRIDTSLTLEKVRNQEVALVEKKYLQKLLTIYKGKINETAKAAGVGVRQLHKLMKKHGIHKEEFKQFGSKNVKSEQ